MSKLPLRPENMSDSELIDEVISEVVNRDTIVYELAKRYEQLQKEKPDYSECTSCDDLRSEVYSLESEVFDLESKLDSIDPDMIQVLVRRAKASVAKAASLFDIDDKGDAL